MKKIITSVLLLIGINTIGMAQATIPNQGLENWEQVVVKDSVKHWKTSTLQYQSFALDINNAYLINDAQEGNKAIHLETILSGIDTLIGFIMKQDADDGFVGFPYSDMVTNLKGWYKCNTIANDTALAVVVLSNNGTVYSETTHKFVGNVSTWTQFNIPLTNGNTLTPDSVFIGFVSSNFESEDNREAGNWLEIDNVWLENNNVTTTAIPGYSFEETVEESIEQPSDFWTFDKLLYYNGNEQYVTKSNDAAEGLSSMKIEKTQSNEDSGLIPFVTNGNFSFQTGFNSGTPFIAQPNIYSFQYKYTTIETDTAFAILNLFKDGITLNQDSIIRILATDIWSTKVLAININEAPDSVRVTFFPGDSIGSALYIDDIQFSGGDVSINETTTNNWTIYPNPANSELNIKTTENTLVTIVDLSGKTVYSNFRTSTASSILTANWNTGVYFVTIRHHNKVETKKIIIQH